MNDSGDPNDEVQYHLEVSPVDLANAMLLLGSPERVDGATTLWDGHEERASHREYRTAMGSYDGMSISVTSAGTGSFPAAITVEEFARVGTDTFIRVGSCGAIQPEIDVSDPVITSGVAQRKGTSKEYVRRDYPAIVDHEVVSALIAAAGRLGYGHHVGLMMSADSFYARQGHPGLESFHAAGFDSLAEELHEANVKNIEMKTAALLTTAGICGLHAGVVCSVYANRIIDGFRTEGESRAAGTASLAVHPLVRMGEVKRGAGVNRWHADLSLD